MSSAYSKKFTQALDDFGKFMLHELEPLPMEKQQKISPTDSKSIHKKLLSIIEGSDSENFGVQISSTYRDFQEEFTKARDAWQQHFSFYDPSPIHFEEIKHWIDSLPEETIFVSPASGKGLFEACIQVSSRISIRCNDIHKQERPFVAEMQQMDAIDFLNQVADEEKPIVVIASWLPGKRDANSNLSERIFKWAHDTRNKVVGVIHVSEIHDEPHETLVASTDTVAALRFKQANFTTVVEIPRENPSLWMSDYRIPINDSLTIVVPNKKD